MTLNRNGLDLPGHVLLGNSHQLVDDANVLDHEVVCPDAGLEWGSNTVNGGQGEAMGV